MLLSLIFFAFVCDVSNPPPRAAGGHKAGGEEPSDGVGGAGGEEGAPRATAPPCSPEGEGHQQDQQG